MKNSKSPEIKYTSTVGYESYKIAHFLYVIASANSVDYLLQKFAENVPKNCSDDTFIRKCWEVITEFSQFYVGD